MPSRPPRPQIRHFSRISGILYSRSFFLMCCGRTFEVFLLGRSVGNVVLRTCWSLGCAGFNTWREKLCRPCQRSVFGIWSRSIAGESRAKIVQKQFRVFSLLYFWQFFMVNKLKRHGQKLRRIILQHFGLVASRFGYGKNRKALIFMISGFLDVSMTLKTNYFYLWRHQET